MSEYDLSLRWHSLKSTVPLGNTPLLVYDEKGAKIVRYAVYRPRPLARILWFDDRDHKVPVPTHWMDIPLFDSYAWRNAHNVTPEENIRVLVYEPKILKYYVATYSRNSQHHPVWNDEGGRQTLVPSLWMYLPSPPSVEEGIQMNIFDVAELRDLMRS